MIDHPTIPMTDRPDEPSPVDTYITFGTQYGAPPLKERHPVFDWVTGDGYVRITAPTWESARALAFAIFGAAWAFDYDHVPGSDTPERNYYPDGELAHITLSLERPTTLGDVVGIHRSLRDVTQVIVDGVVVAETQRIDLA